MTPQQFVEKWAQTELSERAASQEHFIDLCRLIGEPEGGWSEDWAAAWIDTGAGQKLPVEHPLAAERARVDQMVLGNLLRLNRQTVIRDKLLQPLHVAREVVPTS